MLFLHCPKKNLLFSCGKSNFVWDIYRRKNTGRERGENHRHRDRREVWPQLLVAGKRAIVYLSEEGQRRGLVFCEIWRSGGKGEGNATQLRSESGHQIIHRWGSAPGKRQGVRSQKARGSINDTPIFL